MLLGLMLEKVDAQAREEVLQEGAYITVKGVGRKDLRGVLVGKVGILVATHAEAPHHTRSLSHPPLRAAGELGIEAVIHIEVQGGAPRRITPLPVENDHQQDLQQHTDQRGNDASLLALRAWRVSTEGMGAHLPLCTSLGGQLQSGPSWGGSPCACSRHHCP